MFENPKFWVAVSFLLFVAIAARPAYRAVTGALDRRAAKIKAELDEAQTLREEAQHLLAEYQRKQRDAAKEAEEIVAHAKEEAQRLRQQAAADLEAAIARRGRQAVEKIEQAEATALKDVRNQVVDIAMAAAAKLLSEAVDKKQADALIDQSIRELPQKLH